MPAQPFARTPANATCGTRASPDILQLRVAAPAATQSKQWPERDTSLEVVLFSLFANLRSSEGGSAYHDAQCTQPQHHASAATRSPAADTRVDRVTTSVKRDAIFLFFAEEPPEP